MGWHRTDLAVPWAVLEDWPQPAPVPRLPMRLYTREYGSPRNQPPVVLLHGLFGSSANWHGIARRLEGEHHLIVPDLRNHGRSPHAMASGYEAMAGDVLELLDGLGGGAASLVGHSMGGKVALWLALRWPERVARVAALDIAPVGYSPRFGPLLKALETLDLTGLHSRMEADALLAGEIRNTSLRAYLLQNLVLEQGHWRWRMSLTNLREALPHLLDFPHTGTTRPFTGPTLFLYGARSDYIEGRYLPQIRTLFPFARLRAVAGAGHWLYAEQPETVTRALQTFLQS